MGTEVRKAALGETGKTIDDVMNAPTKRAAVRKRQRQLEIDEANVTVAEREEKPRMSKKARKKGQGGSNGAEDFGEFDVKVDGIEVNSAGDAPGGKAKTATPQFYLSTERNPDEEAKERGLDMEQYQMDLTPDEQGTMQNAKSVIRWDVKKKKYLPVMVAADGRVVKQMNRKDESGAIIKAGSEKDEKSGAYAKWAKSTKKRIQKIGELENEAQGVPLGRWAKMQEQQQKARIVEFGGDDNDESNIHSNAQRKPVVPFHGTIDSQHMTHKQKRMVEKRHKKDTVQSAGPDGVKQELKTAIEIQTVKKKREQWKTKQNPHMRKAKATQAKDKRRKMHEDKQMKYGARTKAKMLVFEGPKKGWNNGKKRKEGPRFGTI